MDGTLNNPGWRSGPWRIAAWTAAAGLMLVPTVAHLASGGFGWTTFDFVLAGVILLLSCSIFDLAARRAPNFAYLAGSAAALAAGFGLFIVNGAVGLVGSEDEAHNMLFLAVILTAIIGSIVARGRPQGMATAMFAAAAAHILVSAGLLIATGGATDGDPLAQEIGLSVFAAIWLASALLFRKAGR